MVPFFLIILLSMLPSGLLDALTDAGIGLSQTSMFIDAIDAIVSRTGLFGFAILCLVLYVFSSACLPVMVGCLLRVTYLQQVRELIMSILTHETLFSILNCLCAVFASFALGILAARHHAMLFRLLAIIHQAVRTIKSNGVLDNSMNVAKHAWPIVDSLVLLTGCLYEVSCLSEQQLCLLALSILLIIFVVFTGVLILAIITFNLVLGHFLAIESTKLCVSFVKASDILSHISTITHDLFLFIYMSDGTIETGDLPMPPDLTIPTATTAVHLVNHTRTVSHSSHISTATHISAHLSKASGPRTAIPQESRGSTPSADLSGQSSTPSRPISRSSHPTTISDLDQCIRIVDSCMERIQELQTETQLLRQKNGHVHQLEVEVELLRARDEHSRRDRFQDEQKFQSMLKGFEFLEAVNADLLAENQDLRQALDRNEEEGNALLKEFVQSFCPQHLDLFSDSGLTSSLSAPKSSSQQPVTPGGDHIPVQTPVKRSLHLPDTPSSGPSLPFSPRTPVIRSVGHISPTSLIKPLHPKTPSGPGLPTPEAMKRRFDPTVKIVVPRCPTTVSSRNSLPCPSSASTNSSYPFEFEPVDHSLSPSPKTIKKYDQGIRLFPAKPGLPCPMRQVFGDRIPEEHSPTIPEDSPSLPRPTPIPVPSRFGRVSVHSLNRPYFGGHGGYGPALSAFSTPPDPDFQGPPSYASSNGSPLPAPSPRPSDDYDPFW
ncbi:hypothetical protein HDK90DRAFT_557939 [Phyllosticta capitalensis]|uniref:Uncharacterized protein n=1 Tax=Phyllosticta capitalensis TaxID=121624 RepID=A0ABR1YH09_9PEZI